MTAALDDLYREILMDHYHSPRGKRELSNSDVENEGRNPLCGDSVQVRLKLNGETVEDVSVSCLGCAISVASGSMLAEIVKGKSLQEVRRIAGLVKRMLKGEAYSDDLELGDLEALEGVKKFPIRIKCALLAWTTLVDGLEAWEHGDRPRSSTTEQE